MLDAESELMHVLSILTLAARETREEALSCLAELDDHGWHTLLEFASTHHVVIRAFGGGEAGAASSILSSVVHAEVERSKQAAARLHDICSRFEEEGCPVVVIKSFDHWPDLGSDLDLLMWSDESRVVSIMQESFGAAVEAQAWSDRVARKLNFRVPGLPKLVEVHFGRLGQAGEQLRLAEHVLSRRRYLEVGAHPFPVPSAEDRVILATLQWLYRHYYIRICDFVDTAQLLHSGELDFDGLRGAAKQAGIWPGVATFLRLVSEYAGHYGSQRVSLPRRVEAAARFGIEKIYPNAGFLRLPLFPQGAELYLRQLVKTMRHRDPKASLRLGLVPPLAMAAGMRYKFTGNTHGIW